MREEAEREAMMGLPREEWPVLGSDFTLGQFNSDAHVLHFWLTSGSLVIWLTSGSLRVSFKLRSDLQLSRGSLLVQVCLGYTSCSSLLVHFWFMFDWLWFMSGFGFTSSLAPVHLWFTYGPNLGQRRLSSVMVHLSGLNYVSVCIQLWFNSG